MVFADGRENDERAVRGTGEVVVVVSIFASSSCGVAGNGYRCDDDGTDWTMTSNPTKKEAVPTIFLIIVFVATVLSAVVARGSV